MGAITDNVEALVRAHFAPDYCLLENQSHLHDGHGGLPLPGEYGYGETHFHLTLVAKQFSGQSRIERQRMVHSVLAKPLAGPVHALSLTLHSPEEAPNFIRV